MWYAALASILSAPAWEHPAGAATPDSLTEIRTKIATQPWAQSLLQERMNGPKDQRQAVGGLEPTALREWVDASPQELRRVFPRQRGNVYHNFADPETRVRLQFEPFNPGPFYSPSTGKTFAPSTNAGIYDEDSRFRATLYEGWSCLFYQAAGRAAADLALLGAVEENQAYMRRAIDLLLLFAESARNIEIARFEPPYHAKQYSFIFTYHREGDAFLLQALAQAFELARTAMTSTERRTIEQDLLERLLGDVMLEPYYTYTHNNTYRWHAAILQTALALERPDLVDWVYGYGEASPENLPEHQSIRRLLDEGWRRDGAFWELCSGYHLYPLAAACEFAMASRGLSQASPSRFPPERYDLTCPRNAHYQTIKNALEWFQHAVMPNGYMPTFGDSMSAQASMADYPACAEVGYRFYNVRAIGNIPELREGKRSWQALLYGAPKLERHELPYTSAYLESGLVVLRSAHHGCRLWAALNTFQPGGAHQHADRLALTWFAQGQLLAIEKSTPYNEAAVRKLGTLSPMHNTLTIDRTSQPQGETLALEQAPTVRHFLAGPWVHAACVDAPDLYPQTTQFRRWLVCIEDLLLDVFLVQGGQTHDWMLHHAGERGSFSFPLEAAGFEPADWLAGGRPQALRGMPDGLWSYDWQAGSTHARVTMLGVPHTTVYPIDTYPIENARITENHPPCPSLCVRREKQHGPFAAVWHAWQDNEQPSLVSIEPGETPNGAAMRIETRNHAYWALWDAQTARFPGGTQIETDAEFALLRDDGAAAWCGGTFVKATGSFACEWQADGPANYISQPGQTQTAARPPIAYHCVGGRIIEHPRPAYTAKCMR